MSTVTTPIPLLDLRRQYDGIRDEITRELERVIESQRFILGEEVELLEAEVSGYSGAAFGVGCASGSDALLLALVAAGVGPGDEVVTVPYTFFATAGSIVHAGARPVFVDIDGASFNLDPAQLEQALQQHPRVKAILPVHLFGGCADMDEIHRVAAKYGVPVIEDAAQAIGAEYKGRRAGSLGEMGCFSFFPSKNLGAFGDGGMITTNNAGLAAKLRALRVHGSRRKYYHESVGYNSRLDALQAAVLRVKLRHLDNWSQARGRNAALYRSALGTGGVPVQLPVPATYQTRHIWNQFVIRCPQRDRLQQHLAENGVGTEVYYPVPLHLQACFAELGYREGAFPASEQLANEALALPVYAEITAGEIRQVAASIASFYR